MGVEIFQIEPAKCTECVGHFDEPQCVLFCPVDCIIPDPDHKETDTQLQDKCKALQLKKADCA